MHNHAPSAMHEIVNCISRVPTCNQMPYTERQDSPRTDHTLYSNATDPNQLPGPLVTQHASLTHDTISRHPAPSGVHGNIASTTLNTGCRRDSTSTERRPPNPHTREQPANDHPRHRFSMAPHSHVKSSTHHPCARTAVQSTRATPRGTAANQRWPFDDLPMARTPPMDPRKNSQRRH